MFLIVKKWSYFVLFLLLFILSGCGLGDYNNSSILSYPDKSSYPNYSDYSEEKNTECVIKWNISYKSQEKIYHIPWCPNYSDTVINTTYGERWFCTEEEARAAWWRKAYNCP